MSNTGIVILGGAGMLGHKLFQVLRQRFPGTVATTRASVSRAPLDRVSLLQGSDVVAGVDVNNFDALHARLRGWSPAVIVNCVGVIKQRDAAKSAIPSLTINSLLPHRLAEAAAEWGGRVIHFSTDCVFSGRKGNYTEADQSDAEDLYGKSKFLGEIDSAPNAITLRTSIIGRELTEHRSLLDWFLSQNGSRVRGFRRVIYSGITTNEMANVVTRVIDQPALAGRYQVVSEPISKYDLLTLIRDAYRLDIEIAPDEDVASDRSMRGDRFTEASGWLAPSWPEMVRQLAADVTPYGSWGIQVLKSKQMELNNV